MLLLIVDDSSSKLRKVRECIDSDAVVVSFSCVTDALEWMQENKCDLLILDLQLPIRKGEKAKRRGGEELVRKMLRADANVKPPRAVIGLTAFEDLRNDLRERFEQEGWVIIQYCPTKREWELSIQNVLARLRLEREQLKRNKLIVLPLHGIRTFAKWRLILADLCAEENWICPVNRWWYGWFSVFQFLTPWARFAKVRWFRESYTAAIREYQFASSQNSAPSIVAHSFGTFILGNALLRYRDIRVDKVILCGSILPVDFPWDELIENGQVSEVLNDYGTEDPWPLLCSFVIPGSGASGRVGFLRRHERLRDEVHNLSHSEYFDSGQMRSRWITYLRVASLNPVTRSSKFVTRPPGDHPFISFFLCPLVFLSLAALFFATLWATFRLGNLAIDVIANCLN